MKAIKVGDAEYRGIRAIAKERGQFIQYVIAQALRKFIEENKKKP